MNYTHFRFAGGVFFLAILIIFIGGGSYVGFLVSPLLLYIYLEVNFYARDAYRKAREYMQVAALAIATISVSWFFILKSSYEDYVVENIFSIVAAFCAVLAVFYIRKAQYLKPKKYIKDMPNIEQETMYDTGIPLADVYSYRLVKADKVTTRDIELDLVDEKKELKEKYKKEIADIIAERKKYLYDYRLSFAPASFRSEDKVEELKDTLSACYLAVLNSALNNLQNFPEIKISFFEELKRYDWCIEYAILHILETARNYKNTPIGNLGSLVMTKQDKHFIGACRSLGFTSIGRMGVAFIVGYRTYQQKNNIDIAGMYGDSV